MKLLYLILSLCTIVLPLQPIYSSVAVGSAISPFTSSYSFLSQHGIDTGHKMESDELPVKYKFFSVKRLRTKVDLIWETSWERNNTGFEIQLKTRDGEWRKVAFVFSQTLDGNSNTELTYEYTDVNTERGESQYRLRQLDKDQQEAFSEVRSIRGYQ